MKGHAIRVVRTLVLLSAVAAAGACSPGFDDPTVVEDFRLLSARTTPPQELVAAPPEALFGSLMTFEPSISFTEPVDVAFELLLADPTAEDFEVTVTLDVCVLGTDLRCRDDVASARLLTEAPFSGDDVSTVVAVPADVLNAGLAEDAIKGIFGAALWFSGEVDNGVEKVRFLKSFIVMPDYSGGAQEENRNPTVTEIRQGEEGEEVPLEVDAEGRLAVAAGEKVRLLPVLPEEDRQKYIVYTFDQDPSKPQGTAEEKDEDITVFFRATCGKLSTESKTEQVFIFLETEEDKEDKNLSVEWTAPDEPGLCTIWFLAEDGRGGTDWVTVEALVE